MTSLYVTGVGAATALGLDAERTVASLRSGLDAFAKVPFWGEHRKDLQAARILGYAEGVSGVQRFEALAMKALVPAIGDVPAHRMHRLVLFLGLPRATRPGVPDRLAEKLVPQLARRLRLPTSNIRPIAAGRPSAFLGLREAVALCAEGFECIVGGVDCLVNRASLAALSKARLLKEAWDGFIPGEGAAFVRLSPVPSYGPWGPPASGVAGIGVATEPADGTREHPLVGVGVSRAFLAAASEAGLKDGDIGLCINDVNGARAAFEDEAYGWIRFFRSQRPDAFLEVQHVASYLGESGAAVGGLLLIWGSAVLDLGMRSATGVLLSASDDHIRTAVVLRPGRRRSEPSGQRSLRPFDVGIEATALHAPEAAPRSRFDEDIGLKIAGIDRGDVARLEQNLDALGAMLTVVRLHHMQGTAPWQDLAGYEDRLVAHADALGWGRGGARACARPRLSSGEPDEAAAAALVLLSFPVDTTDSRAIIEAATKDAAHASWIHEACLYAPPSTAAQVLSMMTTYPALAPGAFDAARVANLVRVEHLDPWLGTPLGELRGALLRAYGWLVARDRWAAASSLLTPEDGGNLETVLAALVLSPDARDVFDRLSIRAFADAPLAFAFHFLRAGREVVPTAGILNVPPSIATVEAAGWSGESEAQEWLLAALEHEEEPIRVEAARALLRIYGAGPQERVEVPDEHHPDGKVRVVRLSQSSDLWRRLIVPPPHRPLRYGRPMSARTALESLARPELGTRDRTLAAWEHILRVGSQPPFHPRHPVRRQRIELGKAGFVLSSR